MSTKTTFKRVALVAVAALGMGTLSTTAAIAVPTTRAAHTVYTTSISASTNLAPVAGSIGTEVSHTVRFSTSTTAAVTITPSVILTSRPAGSTFAIGATADGTIAATEAEVTTTLGGATLANFLNDDTVVEAGYTYTQGVVYINAWYDLPGTYIYSIFDDGDNNGRVSGTDYSQTFTVVVGASSTANAYVGAVTVRNASTVTDGANGSLVKINLNVAGVAAQPDNAGGVKVTLSGTGKVAFVNAGAVTTPTSTYILGRNDFDGDGNAWINVTNAASEVVTLTLSGSGSVTNFTAPSAVTITTVAEVASTAAGVYVYVNKGAATGLKQTATAVLGTDGAATANKTATSVTLATGAINTTSSAYKDAVTVTDTTGGLFGLATAKYDILVSAGASTCVASATVYCGTFSVATAFTSTITGENFSASDMTGTGDPLVVTSATAAATTATVTSADVIRSVYAATHSFTVNVDDQFGLNLSNVAVSAAIAGRNSTVNVASAISNASGNAVLTYTDASTSTTSLTDTLTFTAAAGVTDTASVTYTSLAGLGVSTVLATTSQTSATTGADLTTITPFAIAAGSDGVEAGRQTVTITVKDANAVGIAGVPVTVTIAGAGSAVYSTSALVYTGATGVATASVYAWLAPTYGTNYVVTATAGGVADTVNTYWGQANADHTRTFTATSAGRVVTVVAKDRLGNPVYGASFTARITSGDGFFGTGTNVATGTTDATGTMKFITLESPTDQVVTIKAGDSSTYAQTDAPAGNISTADPLDVFTAATAGTATTAETGVGATLAPAGINTVTVSITGAPSATEATSQGAADAAAEATDAANAATDAANAAAEAADAATAAAQDAADAVAALSAQVSTMMASLKAQLTALTNLVIKIQKKVKA
jgi:hypothetical protein